MNHAPRLAALAIIRDELPYIEEWIRWHAAVGVERFYIYLNGGSNHDATMAVIADVARDVGVDGDITIWPGEVQQYRAYRHGIMRARADGVEWLAVIDADEFLQPNPDHASALTYLNARPADVSCVEARWAMYGTGGHEHADLTQPVVGRFTFRKRDPHPLCKSIVRPERFRDFVESHHFHVDGITVEAPFNQFRVNHYWTKSVEECRARFERGRVDLPQKREWTEFTAVEDELNEQRDLSAWAWLERAGYRSSVTLPTIASTPADFHWAFEPASDPRVP